tara:strand:- start:6041 stop:6514 length:474 start_codon:yes stop_codon:yes gene_type:complete
MAQFEKDYKFGKQSELDSLKDLNRLFKTSLKINEDQYAHFDYYNDDMMVELKTRPNTTYENNTIYHKTRNGFDMELDTLYFDSTKMGWAFQHNKKLNPINQKDFFIVWKCKDKYLSWKINWKKKDYYIEPLRRDFGHGYLQDRAVTNVYKDSLIPLN